jgi:hypothetical protein
LTEKTERKADLEGIFVDFWGAQKHEKYPAWRYHKLQDPLLVNNTEEDAKAAENGFEDPMMPACANRSMINWFWDLEDMSPNQLVVFAKDEYGVELPIEAGQEKLFKVVMDLGRSAPRNQGRIVLMAHTIEMNLDQTQETIRKMAGSGMSEIERREVIL